MNQSEATSKFIERSQTDFLFTLSQEMTFQELASMVLGVSLASSGRICMNNGKLRSSRICMESSRFTCATVAGEGRGPRHGHGFENILVFGQHQIRGQLVGTDLAVCHGSQLCLKNLGKYIKSYFHVAGLKDRN